MESIEEQEPVNTSSAIKPEPIEEQEPTHPVEPTEPKEPDIEVTAEDAEAVIESNNMLAMDLYDRYRLEDGNLFFSPYSISSALTMTYEGAKGKTKDEMQEVLHLPDDEETLRSGHLSLYNEINEEEKHYLISIANALWAQEAYPFVEEYFELVDRYYHGKVNNLDFVKDPEGSRTTINYWVEEKTYERIKDLIPQGIIGPDTRLVLTNAIYFKANWSEQFDAADTGDGTFTLDSGESVTTEMMHRTGDYNYWEDDGLQVLELDYIDEELSMLILLPKKNDMSDVEDNLDMEAIDDYRKNLESQRVRLTLPKFSFETKYLMSSDLKAMGMPTAFLYPDADFTGMSPRGELYIYEVIHQTFIEVAEYGTEAAAATAVVMAAGSVPRPATPFTADHPFIFLIQQKGSGNILFMGRMSDPTTE